jgi:hypothetical protein
VHPWLKPVRAAIVPGHQHPLMARILEGVGRQMALLGHTVLEAPDAQTDLVLTTYRYGKPLGWRQALLFTMRRRFDLEHTPALYTLVMMTRAEYDALMERLARALARDPIRPEDFAFEGLAPTAWQVLVEQGQRGGPILALERLLQAQAKCIRLMLVVGEDEPELLYHFDLVGAHPTSDPSDAEGFYRDIALRIVTTASTTEVTEHEVVGEPLPRAEWQRATTPATMRVAGAELGRRDFFTRMIRVDDLIQIPAVSDVLASQYSEGCFATWDPHLGALVATVTGSARPVDKGNLTDDDLAVIVGVTASGNGAQVRQVEGKLNTPPSTEAVEMMEMDAPLPRIRLGAAWEVEADVPVIRSRLHGHRGVGAYHPDYVQFMPLDAPFYHYIVSCGTGAQAQGIKAAFARSEALRNPDDPRQVVFTVLPGHGVMIVEKWVPGKAPFQVIWEYMDAGYIQIAKAVPQGPMRYLPDERGIMRLALS